MTAHASWGDLIQLSLIGWGHAMLFVAGGFFVGRLSKGHR